MTKKLSYQEAFKATTLFGGIQFLQIIISIIRSKFVAILLGPTGMGVMGLLTATTSLISSLTNFGLSTSAVKDIASAQATGNKTKLSTIVIVFNRWLWITGIIGFLITLIFAPFLSQVTFGNKNYSVAFAFISITLLINQISNGQKGLLRGLRLLKHIAKSTLYGSIIGLFTTIPLYYFFKLDGIVPGLIVTALASLLLSWYFANKVKIKKIYVSKIRTFAEGKGMLKMGFMLSLSGLVASGSFYVLRAFISQTGGINEVGMYNAGFTIINTYVGLIFTAMVTDYYPRLASVSNNNLQCKEKINEQGEIALLILAPIIIIFLVFINWIIILLYSSKFIGIVNMMQWAILGIIAKAVSWSISIILLAKSESKLFFWNELIANIYMLALNIGGYRLFKLEGLGISFLIGYVLYSIQVYSLSNRKYKFSFNLSFLKILLIQSGLAISGFLIVKFAPQTVTYIVGIILILISSGYSLYQLNKRIEIKHLFNSLTNKSK